MDHGGRQYTVIFPGCDASGNELLRIKARLAAAFKMLPQQVDRLCGARDVIVRRGIGLAEAEKYQDAFKRAGAACRIVADNDAAAAPALLTIDTLDKFFVGAIPKVKTSFGYQLGMTGVALVMVLLPVLYVLLL